MRVVSPRKFQTLIFLLQGDLVAETSHNWTHDGYTAVPLSALRSPISNHQNGTPHDKVAGLAVFSLNSTSLRIAPDMSRPSTRPPSSSYLTAPPSTQGTPVVLWSSGQAHLKQASPALPSLACKKSEFLICRHRAGWR